MNNSVLEAKQLCVERDGLLVLNQVSFHVAKGEVFALLGGNGAGKSTTLLTFLGFLNPSGGSVFVNGAAVTNNVEQARRQMAYLPESANLYPHLSARENVRYFLSLGKIEASDEEIENTFDRVLLNKQARDKRLGTYSKGMRQKVAIALAMLRKTPVLLLDEPTSGLDPSAIEEFNQILLTLAESGTTILMVTHDLYGACCVARRIGLLRQGSLVKTYNAPHDGLISVEEVHRDFALHSNS